LTEQVIPAVFDDDVNGHPAQMASASAAPGPVVRKQFHHRPHGKEYTGSIIMMK